MHLYITEQGTRLSKRGNHLLLAKGGEVLKEVLFDDIEGAMLFGAVNPTSDALSALLSSGSDVSFFSSNGRLKGRLVSNVGKNVGLRLLQYDAFRDEGRSFDIAKGFVLRKIENGIKVLNSYNVNAHNPFKFENRALLEKNLEQIRQLSNGDKNTLRGYEGYGAKLYFENFAKCLMHGIDFKGREYRPCKDPVNTLLSLGYTFVANSLESLIESYGLDTAIGFLHEPSYGRASLAFDLLEEFRHPFVDRLVLKLLNCKLINRNDFEKNEGTEGLRLKPSAMRTFIRVYEEFCDSSNRICKDNGEVSWRKVFRQRVESFRGLLLDSHETPFVLPAENLEAA